VVTALLGFAAASVLLVLLPGPDTLVVVRNMARGGRRRAVATVLGILVGLAFWIAAASLGLAAVLRASDTGYAVLRYVGGAYLVYVGAQALRVQHTPAEQEQRRAKHRPLLGSGFTAGLLTDLLNPKVGVTFVTLLPAFIPHGAAVGTTSLALGVVYIAETLVYFAVLIVLADRVLAWMNAAGTRRRIERVAGVVFIGFGIRLAVEQS
jgi:RhtB (resistance to homoserine/threonine) family protein